MRIRGRYSAAGIILVAVLSAEPSAGFDTGFYSVPLRDFSPAVYGAREARYLVFSSDENFSLPGTPFQCVESTRRVAGGVEVRVRSGAANPAGGGNRAGLTSDTRLLAITSPEIRNIAAKFSGRKDPVPAVTRFVFDHITRKTEGIPIVSAREVLKSRTGDCTEHAVLSVAILRALGIPSRAMVGMILSESFRAERNVFVFHMWAEAWTGGRWVLADATRPGQEQPQRYIAFACHSLRAEMPLEYLGAVSAIRDLSVRLVGNQ